MASRAQARGGNHRSASHSEMACRPVSVVAPKKSHRKVGRARSLQPGTFPYFCLLHDDLGSYWGSETQSTAGWTQWANPGHKFLLEVSEEGRFGLVTGKNQIGAVMRLFKKLFKGG